MKSNIYKSSKIAFVTAIVAVAAIALAQSAQAAEVSAVDGAFSNDSAAVSGSPSITPPTMPIPPANKPPLRTTIRTNIENRIEANSEVRNTTLEQRQEIRGEATTTIKNLRTDTREQIASTTDMFKRAAGIRQDIKAKMDARVYAIRKDALTKELTLSLTNIANVSTRIDAEITKADAAGKTTTDAKALLVTANDKLTQAKADVAAFQALNISATSTPSITASTTTQVDLTKPRVEGDSAIKSVKEARDAFQKVVAALAHDLGEKLPPPPTPSPSASVSVSSTATN